MKTIGARLSYLIETQNISMKKFCEIHGLSYQSINPICNNRREIGINLINDLIKVFPNLNINWLIYGTGSINYTKSDDIENEYNLAEPGEEYGIDVMEKVFLHYLEKNNVRKKILEIVSDEK